MDGFLTEIGRIPNSIKEIEGQYMGLTHLTPPGWRELINVLGGLDKVQRDKIQMTNLLQRILISGRLRIEAVPFDGVWGEVDSKSDLDLYEASALVREALEGITS